MSVPDRSIDQLMTPQFWSQQRNRVLGVSALIIVGAVLWHFFSSRSEGTQAAGWEALWQPTAQSSIRSDVDVDGAVKGTSAEPWALFVRAQKAFEDKDFESAERFAQRLLADFPNHSRVRDGATQRLLDQIAGEKAFVSAHPPKLENPHPDANKSLTLTTELGEIRLGLYPDLAPTAVKTLLEATRAAGGSGWQIDEAQRDAFVVLSAPTTATEAAPKQGSTAPAGMTLPPAIRGAVPDRNALSHFKGAVGIMRQPETLAAKDAPRFKIRISLRDEPYSDDNEVVLGTVAQGLELLQQASTRELKKGGRTLEKPVAVTKLVEGADLSAIH